MPPKRKQPKAPKQLATVSCQHTTIQVEPSTHAPKAGYIQPSPLQRAKAQAVKLQDFSDRPFTFPAPLVLPDDGLAIDPRYPAQSVLSWTRGKTRNEVTSRRGTIYLATPPLFDPKVSFAQSWAAPLSTQRDSTSASQLPETKVIADYVRAFYYPLPVKFLPTSTFKFVPWSASDLTTLQTDQELKQPQEPTLLGLRTCSEVIGIRTRAAPLQDFPRQLNLDDLLEAAVASLPSDAYALLMLVDQDLYEDEDDDFVCGRAYGASRVAIVSSARYNPTLDVDLELDLNHVWPLSHCWDFVNRSDSKKARRLDKEIDSSDKSPDRADRPPLEAAISAATAFRSSTSESATARWLGRICRTVSHELGHCFGIDHCVYYACGMQGSASLKEDHRQPPYLCPIDSTKVLRATGSSEDDHLRAMLCFCTQHEDVELFVAYAAWLQSRLKEL